MLVVRAAPAARTLRPAAQRTAALFRRSASGWALAARSGHAHMERGARVERLSNVAAWARFIQHTASSAVERTPPAASGSASIVAPSAMSVALADVAPSSVLPRTRLVGATSAPTSRWTKEEQDHLLKMEQENLPLCEQLAVAGAWKEPAPVDMEASYEGLTVLNPEECPRELEDRLPRWPDLTTGGVVRAGDYMGTAVFSMTGTLTAAGAGMDVLGCCLVGTITAVGGGTIRDILIARDENGQSKRAFWMDEPEYLYIAMISSVGTFFLWNSLAESLGLDESDVWIFWLDSMGIGCFCIIGAMHGIRAGLPFVVCALCGMFTSTFGGMTRDVLSHRPVRILHSHSEIYALTAFLGASAYLSARAIGLSYAARAAAGIGTAIGMRYMAWTSDVRLPALERVYSTQAVVKAQVQAENVDAGARARRPGHSSGAEALHKREYQRLVAFLNYGAPAYAEPDESIRLDVKRLD